MVSRAGWARARRAPGCVRGRPHASAVSRSPEVACIEHVKHLLYIYEAFASRFESLDLAVPDYADRCSPPARSAFLRRRAGCARLDAVCLAPRAEGRGRSPGSCSVSPSPSSCSLRSPVASSMRCRFGRSPAPPESGRRPARRARRRRLALVDVPARRPAPDGPGGRGARVAGVDPEHRRARGGWPGRGLHGFEHGRKRSAPAAAGLAVAIGFGAPLLLDAATFLLLADRAAPERRRLARDEGADPSEGLERCVLTPF